MYDEIVDHSLIAKGDYGPNTIKENKVIPPSKITFTLTSSGFELPQTGDLPNTDYIIGPGTYKPLDSDTYQFEV